MPFGPPTLKARALRALAAREYGRDELRRKLASHAAEGEDLAALLTDLEAKGFLSDARAAASLVRQKAERYGAARVRQALAAKGLRGDTADAALAALDGTEFTRAHALWQRRFDGVLPTDAAARAKQFRYLLARGFSGAVAARVLKGVVPKAEAANSHQSDL